MKLLELFENKKPKPLATKTKTAGMDSMMGNSMFNDDAFRPKTAQSPAKRREQSVALGRATASAERPANMPSVNTAALPADAYDDDFDDFDFGFDPEDEPTTPGTMPAEINKGVQGAGESSPDWYTIDQLPGYMERGIRAVGRQVFKTFTSTPLKDINMLVNLQGNGPTEKQELNAVADFARRKATSDSDLSMHFGEVIPGYEPDAHIYTTKDDTYLVVRDEMGDYIYSWPTTDTKDNFQQSKQLPGRSNPRLGNS